MATTGTYVTVAEFKTLTTRTPVVSALSDDEILAGLTAASEEANSYLGSQFGLPLKSWGDDLRQKVGEMALWYILKRRGLNPNVGEYTVLRDGYKDATAWFARVAAGQVYPQSIVDSTDEDVHEGNLGISTTDAVGW